MPLIRHAIGEVIVAEGKYDVNKLRQIFSSPVIATDGFGIYNQKDLLFHIDRLSQSRGIVILTDSDSAGNQIRALIKNRCRGRVLNAYIPEVEGKEKRKSHPSGEGKLGVEGMPDDVIIEAVRRSGACFVSEGEALSPPSEQVTRLMLYEDGIFGGSGCRERREKLCRAAKLPSKLGTEALIEALNSFYGKEGYRKLLSEL